VNILFLSHRLPFPPNRGDRILAYHLLRHMRAYAAVDVVSLVHSSEEASQASGLSDIAASVHVMRVPRVQNLLRAGFNLAGDTPLTHVLLNAPGIGAQLAEIAARRRPDVVVAFGSGMAPFALAPPLDAVPLVIHMVDVDSAKWAALAERTKPPLRWVYAREARTLGRFEAAAARKALATVLVADREGDALKRLAPGAQVHVMPNGVDVSYFTPTSEPNRTADVVFCGVMDYAPNVEGALWFAREVWPAVRRQYPNSRLKLVGSSPASDVRALASDKHGIVVTGPVPDVRPHLWSSAVSVAPLFVARGIQNKVLEAVAAGLPTVLTSPAAGGVPADVLAACTVADTAETFAAAVMNLLAMSSANRDAVVRRADLSALTWEHALAPFRTIVESALSSSASPPA